MRPGTHPQQPQAITTVYPTPSKNNGETMVQPCGHNLQPTSTPNPTCTPNPNLTLSNSRPMAGAGAPVQGHPRRVRGQLRPSATLAAAHRHRAARHAQRRPGALQHPRWGGGAPACTLHSWGGRMLCTAPCSAHVSRSVLGVMDCSAQARPPRRTLQLCGAAIQGPWRSIPFRL